MDRESVSSSSGKLRVDLNQTGLETVSKRHPSLGKDVHSLIGGQ